MVHHLHRVPHVVQVSTRVLLAMETKRMCAMIAQSVTLLPKAVPHVMYVMADTAARLWMAQVAAKCATRRHRILW